MSYIMMPDRREAPGDPDAEISGSVGRRRGPRRPDTGSPDKDNLWKRMRKVDPSRRNDTGSGQGSEVSHRGKGHCSRPARPRRPSSDSTQ